MTWIVGVLVFTVVAWIALRWAVRVDRYEQRIDRAFWAEWAEAGRGQAGGSEPDASADLSRPVSVYDWETSSG